MSEFTRPSNTDYARQSSAEVPRRPRAGVPYESSTGLKTTGPLIGMNDVAAFIAAALMVLGPLAGGAFWGR